MQTISCFTAKKNKRSEKYSLRLTPVFTFKKPIKTLHRYMLFLIL
jgi:hypothetical protein